MTNQKHTVSTDALDTLGTCPIPENSGRDAIHLAVEPVTCGPNPLMAGARIKLAEGKHIAGQAIPCKVTLDGDDATGIVDPFIQGWVKPGQQFWFVVLPRTITSLRHVWSHPSFPEAATYHIDDQDDHYMAALDNRPSVPAIEPEVAMSMAWIKEWCAISLRGERYDYIMKCAKEHLENGEYCYGEHDRTKFDSVDFNSQFWFHYQRVTKTIIPAEDQNSFFSCSC